MNNIVSLWEDESFVRKNLSKKRVLKILIVVAVVVLCIYGVKKVANKFGIILEKSNIQTNYDHEWDNISKEDAKIIKKAISLANEKVGMEYVWGGKGEIITEQRLDELIKYYGENQYPLDRDQYIGIQAFDCSGLVYWVYEQATGVNIGYSTTQQREILEKYKVKGDLQPGDLIYTTRHVVMYVGNGKIIQSKNKFKYPKGGIHEQPIGGYTKGVAYRPIDYINDQNKFDNK